MPGIPGEKIRLTADFLKREGWPAECSTSPLRKLVRPCCGLTATRRPQTVLRCEALHSAGLREGRKYENKFLTTAGGYGGVPTIHTWRHACLRVPAVRRMPALVRQSGRFLTL